MPWTPRQVRYLLSSGTPLSSDQKQKMLGELHDQPSLGHAKKGSRALSQAAAGRIRKKANVKT